MNSTMTFLDLYGGARAEQSPAPNNAQLAPIYSGNGIAGWFIGLVVLLAVYYALSEWVL